MRALILLSLALGQVPQAPPVRTVAQAPPVWHTQKTVFVSQNSVPQAPEPKAEIQWLTDYDKALSLAIKKNQKTLILFCTFPCEPCDKMAETLQENPSVIKDMVLLKLDSRTNKERLERLKVSSFPTVWIVEPDLTITTQIEGAVSSDFFLAKVQGRKTPSKCLCGENCQCDGNPCKCLEAKSRPLPTYPAVPAAGFGGISSYSPGVIYQNPLPTFQSYQPSFQPAYQPMFSAPSFQSFQPSFTPSFGGGGFSMGGFGGGGRGGNC